MRGEIHRGSTANPAAGAVPGRGSAHDASIRMTVARFLEEGDQEVRQGSARDSAGRAAPSKRGNPARAPARVILALLLDAVGQFLGREDAPRYIAIGLLALVFVSMPWDVLAVVFLCGLVAGVAGLVLGKEQVRRLAVGWYVRTRERDPEWAETVRLFAARSSKTASGWLAKLPANWTAGLYLPDFEEPQPTPPKMRSDPFDRLGT